MRVVNGMREGGESGDELGQQMHAKESGKETVVVKQLEFSLCQSLSLSLSESLSHTHTWKAHARSTTWFALSLE